MRTTILAIAASALGLTFLTNAPAQQPKRSLAGDWTVVSAVADGKPLPDELRSKVFIRGTATTLTPVEDGTEQAKDMLELKFLDGNKVDFTEKRPGAKAKPGILEFVDDNTFKFAFADGLGELVRPTGFEGGQNNVAIVLKRKAK